ncbi:MAG TPA: hypothetical protein VN783_02505, partial [Thermoanaerobaculia bacterium]|nr:hypothetical protein [Thermoanaerobaculia bacterium]
MRRTNLLALLGLAAFALGAARCNGDPASEASAVRPLFDGLHAPDLLTEAGALELPPSLGGNRFLAGWVPWRDGERVVLAPQAGGARVEIVHLAARDRRLILDLLDVPGEPLAGGVRVRAGEREIGTFPWRDPLEIPLPGDLPLGRVAIDLLPVGAQAPGVVGAALRPSLPAGPLRIEGKDLVQAGTSRAEVVVRIGTETDLIGTFVPPEHPEPDQRWQVTLEREDGSNIRRFDWSASFWNRLRGERGFRLPLRGATGLVRVRLDAEGDGPPGRWRNLAWAGPPPPPMTPPIADLTPGPPPRLVVLYVFDALRADRVGF